VVLAISLALVVGLILFFESRDQSQVEEGGALPGPPQAPQSCLTVGGSRLVRRANTTSRCAALYSGWQALRTSRS
jgi:hypothetical protein